MFLFKYFFALLIQNLAMTFLLAMEQHSYHRNV